MRAVVHDRYGSPDVLRLAEVADPIPAADEVLVRVEATTVNRTDCGFRTPEPFFVRVFSGLIRPKHTILGSEFAGVVERVGDDVTRFHPGDRVFGVNADSFGANAELLCVRQDAPMATMPEGLPFEVAAAASDGAILALSNLRRADLHGGQELLVYGASGAIGTAAVQLGREFDVRITAVCNTANVDLVQSLGPDRVIDYTRDDFTREGTTYDVIFDSVGKEAFLRCRRALKPAGIFLETDLGYLWQNPFWQLWTRFFGKQRLLIPTPEYTQDNVRYIKELLEKGSFRPVIDRHYPLDEAIEATRYVETETKTGNVVLTVDSG